MPITIYKRKPSKGFTLIELLVVTSIISFMSTIVLASVNTARDRATIAAGQSFSKSLDNTIDSVAGSWGLNDASGTNAKDDSITAQDGVISGTYSWVTGMYGGALRLTGGSINFGNNSAYDTSQFTIAFWIRPDSITSTVSTNNIILGREVYLVSGYRVGIANRTNIAFWTTQSGGTLNMTAPNAVSVGKYSHVAFTYKSGVMTIYVNGKQAAKANGTLVVPTGSTFGLQINGGIGGTFGANATYDNIRYYSVSLMANDIERLYAESAGKYVATN